LPTTIAPEVVPLKNIQDGQTDLNKYELMANALELHMICEFETFEDQIYLEKIKTLLMEPLMFQ
jgi:hypothetical protein